MQLTKLKTKDVLSIVDEKGHVSAADIAGAFDIPIEKACEISNHVSVRCTINFTISESEAKYPEAP